MRMSRAITVTLLSAAMLTACCVATPGCGRRTPDTTWYDASGNRIEERWKTNPDGTRVLDEQGRPIPDPHVPYDRYHRPWVFANGVWAPLPPPASSSSSSSSYRSSSGSSWWWGGDGYRTTTTTPTYRSGSGSGGSSGSGGTSAPAGSSITRGGFGSTGMAASS
jgi:hypothetical protein